MPQTPWIAAAALSPLVPNLHFQRGEFVQAQAGYRALHQVEGELRTLLRLDRWQDAIALGERSLPVTPEREGLLALAYLRGGQPLRAQESALWASQRNPRAYWPLVARGTIALRWEEASDRALGFLRQAIGLRPDLPEGWLAVLAVTSDRAEEARAVAALTGLSPRGYPFDFWGRPQLQNRANAQRFWDAFPEGELFAPAKAPPPVQTLGLKRDPRGMLYFQAEIDGIPLRLLYDTGGGRHLLLTPKAIAQLRPKFVARTVVTGLQGQSGGAIHRAERLTVGDLELRSLLLESVPGNLGGFDGLIGWRVFGERIQQLDLRRTTVTLRDKPEPEVRGAITLPLHLIQDQPVVGVQCRLEGKTTFLPLWAILDTGAIQDFFSLKAGSQLTHHFRRQRLAGVMGIGETHRQIEMRTLTIGFDLLSLAKQPLTSYTQATAASFLDEVHNPASGFEHGLLLGMDFLSRFSMITFDLVGRQVRLVPQ